MKPCLESDPFCTSVSFLVLPPPCPLHTAARVILRRFQSDQICPLLKTVAPCFIQSFPGLSGRTHTGLGKRPCLMPPSVLPSGSSHSGLWAHPSRAPAFKPLSGRVPLLLSVHPRVPGACSPTSYRSDVIRKAFLVQSVVFD